MNGSLDVRLVHMAVNDDPLRRVVGEMLPNVGSNGLDAPSLSSKFVQMGLDSPSLFSVIGPGRKILQILERQNFDCFFM